MVFKVQVETPEALVDEQLLRVFPVPEDANTGVIELKGLELVSRSVIVIVARSVLSAVWGPVEVMVEFKADASPAMNSLVVERPRFGLVSVSVIVSATVDVTVQLASPDEFVAAQLTDVTPVEEETLRDGVVPTIAIPAELLSVTLTVLAVAPSAAFKFVTLVSELWEACGTGLVPTTEPDKATETLFVPTEFSQEYLREAL